MRPEVSARPLSPSAPSWSLVALLLAANATAQTSGPTEAPQEPARELEVVTHFIRPGDTLSEITEELLGSSDEWQRNLDLNPGYFERRLQPGERLKVLIDPTRHPYAARIEQRAGTVDGQPQPLRWTSLTTRDLLLENDAARTGNASSTELVFGDGMSITVAEDSLVFLRKLRDRLVIADSSEVEVVEGQADLSLDHASAEASSGVDIVLGGARLAVPGSRTAAVRAGRTEEGVSEASIYQGETAAFNSPEGDLQLAPGTGVVARVNEPPVAETLLNAPTVLHPLAATAQPPGVPIQLQWQLPPGDVASSTLELCRDPRCGQLIRRWTELSESNRQIDGLAEGTYHWRVTAISPSGLDGYPSDPVALLVQTPQPPSDSTPPQVRAALVTRPVPYGGRRVVGVRPEFDIEAVDDDGSEASWSFVEQSTTGGTAGQAATAPFAAGRHRVAVEAVDAAGNRSRSEWMEFDVEGSLPAFEVRSLAASPPGIDGAIHRVGWSVGGSSWQPLDTEVAVSVMSAPFTIVLQAGPGRCLVPEGSANDQERCGSTWSISASDAEIGLRRISARLESDDSHEFAVLEAWDRVGNLSTMRFALRR